MVNFLTLESLENFERILFCTMAASSFENLVMAGHNEKVGTLVKDSKRMKLAPVVRRY